MKIKVAEFDRAIINGNRLKVNQAIQFLDEALNNLGGGYLEDDGLNDIIESHLGEARELMRAYNMQMVERGIV